MVVTGKIMPFMPSVLYYIGSHLNNSGWMMAFPEF